MNTSPPILDLLWQKEIFRSYQTSFLIASCILHELDYDTFVQWVKDNLPGHTCLPDAKELPRVAVGSFSKPVCKWDAHNAPVSGKRFRDYCEIARRVEEGL